MQTPLRTAESLLLGLGLVLVLATAFALIDGRLPPDNCTEPVSPMADACTASSPVGWIIPAGAALCLIISTWSKYARNNGQNSLLSNIFSDEMESEIADRVAVEFHDENDTDRLSDAWANMEEKILSTTHGEEE
mgnify:FL=1